MVARAGRAGLTTTNLNIFLFLVWVAQGFQLLTSAELKELEKKNKVPKASKGGRSDLKRRRNAMEPAEPLPAKKKRRVLFKSLPLGRKQATCVCGRSEWPTRGR